MTDITISTPITNASVGQNNVDVTVTTSEVVTSIIGVTGGLNVLGTSVWEDGALVYFDENEAQFVQDANHIKWDKNQKKLIVTGNAAVFTVDTPSNFLVNLNYGTGSFYDYSTYTFEFKLHAYKDTAFGRVYSAPVTQQIVTSASYTSFNFSLSWGLAAGADGYTILVVDPYIGYTAGDYGFDAGNASSTTYDYYSPTLTYFGANLQPTSLSGIADPLEMVTGGIQYGSGVDLNNNDFNFISLGAFNRSYLSWDHTAAQIKAADALGNLRTIRANLSADTISGSAITGNFYGSNFGYNYGPLYFGTTNKLVVTNGSGIATTNANIQVQPTYGAIEQKAGNSTRYVNAHGVLYEASGNINNSGTAETDLISYSLPANMFNFDGQKLRFEFSGVSANNANNKTFKIYFGTNVIYNSGALTNSAAGSWSISGRVIRKNSSTIVFRVIFQASGMSKTQDIAVNETATGFTFTNAIALKISGQGGASSDITHKLTTINFEQVA